MEYNLLKVLQVHIQTHIPLLFIHRWEQALENITLKKEVYEWQ